MKVPVLWKNTHQKSKRYALFCGTIAIISSKCSARELIWVAYNLKLSWGFIHIGSITVEQRIWLQLDCGTFIWAVLSFQIWEYYQSAAHAIIPGFYFVTKFATFSEFTYHIHTRSYRQFHFILTTHFATTQGASFANCGHSPRKERKKEKGKSAQN